jgi:hypothetical protein
MPTEQILIGPVFSMVQNVIYAAPPVPSRLYADTAVVVVQSDTVAFTASTACTLAEGGYLITAPFIKMTSAGPANIRLSRA